MVRVPGLVVLLFFTSALTAQDIASALRDRLTHTANTHLIAVLDPECPISQKYTSPLNDFTSKYHSEGLSVYGLIAVRNIHQAELDSFISYYQISFPCISDPELEIAASLNASVTPEVFLLDENLNVIYSGAIDDWFFDLGRSRRKATVHYLAEAIERRLQNQPIRIKRTDPVGCRISYQKPRKE